MANRYRSVYTAAELASAFTGERSLNAKKGMGYRHSYPERNKQCAPYDIVIIFNTHLSCGGSKICVHGKQKNVCKEGCGGVSICIHGKRKVYCMEGCGGSAMCFKHRKEKYKCKECPRPKKIKAAERIAETEVVVDTVMI